MGVMRPASTGQNVQQVVDLILQLELKEHVSVGSDWTSIAVIGDDRQVDMSSIENGPMAD